MKQLSHSPEAAAYFKGMRVIPENMRRVARPQVVPQWRSTTHVAPLRQQVLGSVTRPAPLQPV